MNISCKFKYTRIFLKQSRGLCKLTSTLWKRTRLRENEWGPHGKCRLTDKCPPDKCPPDICPPDICPRHVIITWISRGKSRGHVIIVTCLTYSGQMSGGHLSTLSTAGRCPHWSIAGKCPAGICPHYLQRENVRTDLSRENVRREFVRIIYNEKISALIYNGKMSTRSIFSIVYSGQMFSWDQFSGDPSLCASNRCF